MKLETVTVNASHLHQLLMAISGPPHLLREILVLRNLQGDANPVNALINQYNQAVDEFNAKHHPTEEKQT